MNQTGAKRRGRINHTRTRNIPEHRKPTTKRIFRIGAIDIPFNYLFVMIAGGAILLAVFAFVQKQQKAFAEDVADTVLRDLGAITSGASAAKGTSQGVDIPDSDIKLECTDECTCGMTIKTVTAQLKDNIVFGQDKLKGTKLILWAQDWNLPLRVTNFLFITTPRIKYYIIAAPNSRLLKSIKERIPDNIEITYIEDGNLNPNTATIDGKKIINLGYDAMRFVMLDDRTGSGVTLPGCATDPSFTDADVSCIAIRPDKRTTGINNAYDIAIMDKTSGAIQYRVHTYRVTGETAAIAAIFSDTSRQFECNMKKAYTRLSYLSLLIADRSNELWKQQSNICIGLTYQPKSDPTRNPPTPKNDMEKMADTAKALAMSPSIENTLSVMTALDPANKPVDTYVWNIHAYLRSISQKNQDLLRQDCPLLY